jgi:hypothetical protein
MPAPQTNGRVHEGHGADKPDVQANRGGIVELIAEAEALRDQLHEAAGRAARLLAGLKQQRRQARAVQAAMASLRQLQLDR